MVNRIVKGVLLLALGVVGLRLGKPYLQSYQFARIIRDDVESQSVRPHASVLQKRIVELGKNFGLDPGDFDVLVSPLASGGFEVKVHYDVPVDLFVYQYNEHFDFISRTGGNALPE